MLAGCTPAGIGGRIVTSPDGTQWQQMSVERLPDLKVPRGNHRTVVCGDEIVVLGGHTDGFKPVETAEFYSNGAWHPIPMLYPHTNGFAARLPDGRILLGGGSDAFGIGQTWGAEVYDPVAHAFTSVGIMSAKRQLTSALARPDGSVLIAGNWMTGDSWETWTPKGGFTPGGPLNPGWSCPFILPAAKDDVMVFGSEGADGNDVIGTVAHIGESNEQVPLLEHWRLTHNYFYFPDDLQTADYSYLIPASTYSKEEYTIIKITAGDFSLLEMEEPLPIKDPFGNPIAWGLLQVDRPNRLAWMQGFTPATGLVAFARIAYDATFDGGKASTSFFFADQGDFPSGAARLLSGGRLALIGGSGWERGAFPFKADYFKTYATAFIFHTEPVHNSGLPLWEIVLIVLVLAAVTATLMIWRKHKAKEAAEQDESRLPRNLMEQISALIEEKELYRRKNLRITDVASELATNKTYVSVLLNNISGESFTAMITRYRVAYAQKLLREHPDMLLDEVADESGFSSRTSFFRNFKAATGFTPAEWKRREGLSK